MGEITALDLSGCPVGFRPREATYSKAEVVCRWGTTDVDYVRLTVAKGRRVAVEALRGSAGLFAQRRRSADRGR